MLRTFSTHARCPSAAFAVRLLRAWAKCPSGFELPGRYAGKCSPWNGDVLRAAARVRLSSLTTHNSRMDGRAVDERALHCRSPSGLTGDLHRFGHNSLSKQIANYYRWAMTADVIGRPLRLPEVRMSS
jgi:hypothetical protein